MNIKKITVAISNRHVHLSEEIKNVLFGENYEFKILKPLSQTGQYACEETVDVITKNGQIKNVRILGPTRNYTQVELSRSDAYLLKINPPVRDSGDLLDTEKVILVGPKGRVELVNSTIVAQRHIHMNNLQAKNLNLKNNDIVSVKVDKKRGGVFADVRVKVDPSYVLEMHIDRDEANAFDIDKSVQVEII